jgi:glycosyltransferase involved in cell wall biosynthesis
MKIAVLTRDKASFGELIRTNAIIAGLREQGHSVDLHSMDRRQMTHAASAAAASFGLAKLRLLSRALGIPTSRAMMKVWGHCIASAHRLIPVLREGKYELLLAEAHYSGLCGWLMRPHLGIPLWVDFHGTAEETIAHSGFYGQALKVEGLLVRECDLAISCSGMMRDHLIAKHGGVNVPHIVCHNGTEPRSKVAEFGLPFRVIFAGLFAYFQRVLDYIEAARLNTDPEIEFYLMGGGEDEGKVLDYIRRHRVRITWLGYKPRSAALDLFTTMQAGVSPATNDIARQVASPIKILDYAACGLPVVTVAVGEWSEIFRSYDAGVVCPRSDGETLLAAIRSLKNREAWVRASSNAQRLVRDARTWPAVLAPLYEQLRSLDTKTAPA